MTEDSLIVKKGFFIIALLGLLFERKGFERSPGTRSKNKSSRE